MKKKKKKTGLKKKSFSEKKNLPEVREKEIRKKLKREVTTTDNDFHHPHPFSAKQ
ncbi:MAG TPA: hypothetical protein VE933_03000 [Chitinophagaceae bacterium]|nr:hypothetical protein [Chitinophagaceae bacterium]